ncbi:GldG family protein [Candidatus Binatia bacterium]|nr:GldG family protein [Candidatus Binatia bacterium]
MKRLANTVAFVLSLAAVLAVAVALQAFSDLYNRRVDLTATQMLSLSPYTLSVLSEVKKPLHVDLYYERGERQRSRDLVELLRDHCPQLTYELVDLDRNPARAKEHRVDHYDRAVLQYDGREVVVFAGSEESLVGGIARILAERARVLYFLDGHKERSLGAGNGEAWSRASQVLRNEGYELRPLTLLQLTDVPSDASAVVLAGPETDLAEGELRALTSYLERGGAVLVAVDPLVLPRLEAWVAGYGFALGDDVVIDRANRVYGSDGTNVVVPYYRDHAAVRSMTTPSVLGRARSVDIAPGHHDDVTRGPSIVARTAQESFAARDASRTRAGEVTFDEQRDRQGPIGIMAVTLVAPDSDRPGRIALVGDADFASDAFFSLMGNKNLLVNVIGWLVPTGAEGARPETAATQLGPMSPMYVSDELAQTIFWSAAVAQPAVVLLIGVLVLVGRRRRR